MRLKTNNKTQQQQNQQQDMDKEKKLVRQSMGNIFKTVLLSNTWVERFSLHCHCYVFIFVWSVMCWSWNGCVIAAGVDNLKWCSCSWCIGLVPTTEAMGKLLQNMLKPLVGKFTTSWVLVRRRKYSPKSHFSPLLSFLCEAAKHVSLPLFTLPPLLWDFSPDSSSSEAIWGGVVALTVFSFLYNIIWVVESAKQIQVFSLYRLSVHLYIMHILLLNRKSLLTAVIIHAWTQCFFPFYQRLMWISYWKMLCSNTDRYD